MTAKVHVDTSTQSGKRVQIFLDTYLKKKDLIFDPTIYCPNHNIPCAKCTENCAPCNSCSKREGYFTTINDDKQVEIKCQHPCRLLKRWQIIKLSFGGNINV